MHCLYAVREMVSLGVIFLDAASHNSLLSAQEVLNDIKEKIVERDEAPGRPESDLGTNGAISEEVIMSQGEEGKKG